jgi:hypothetical protein
MADRTTAVKVREIIDHDTSISMGPFIRVANNIVNWLSSKDTNGELSTQVLEDIETWLAAHFYAHRDQVYQSKSTGRSSAQFQGKTGMYFESTQYGQTALMMDTTGLLRGLSQQKGKARISWLGTNYDQHDSTDPAYE